LTLLDGVRQQWGLTAPAIELPGGKFSRIEQRAAMAVLSELHWLATHIAYACRVHRSTVARWTGRLAAGHDGRDRDRSGRPATLTDQVEIRAVAFYCQTAPLPGCKRWSLRWAEKYLKQNPDELGLSLSRSSLQRLLARQKLAPHRHKYFLQITDPDFFPKMESLVQLYLHPPEYLYCFDECPCIQALHRCDPSLPADTGHPDYVGFDYKRLGTTDLFAFLRPSDGSVFARCRPGHAVDVLCEVFREHVAQHPPDTELHYVMDNLSPHYAHDFCALVGQLSGVEYPGIRLGTSRREWLGSPKRIVVHFTPFHGSWLNLVEVWFGIVKQKCLRDLSVSSLAELLETLLSFAATWNEFYAHPFRWKFTGEGMPLKAVHRFQQMLRGSLAELDVKFLTRQLELMPNIARDYGKEIAIDEWWALAEVFHSQRDELTSLIEAESGPRRKQRAQHAWDQFEEFLEQWRRPCVAAKAA
jgi:transposase